MRSQLADTASLSRPRRTKARHGSAIPLVADTAPAPTPTTFSSLATANHGNTGAATINVNGIGVKAIEKIIDGAAIALEEASPRQPFGISVLTAITRRLSTPGAEFRHRRWRAPALANINPVTRSVVQLTEEGGRVAGRRSERLGGGRLRGRILRGCLRSFGRMMATGLIAPA
jgi:hypothetical protein